MYNDGCFEEFECRPLSSKTTMHSLIYALGGTNNNNKLLNEDPAGAANHSRDVLLERPSTLLRLRATIDVHHRPVSSLHWQVVDPPLQCLYGSHFLIITIPLVSDRHSNGMPGCGPNKEKGTRGSWVNKLKVLH